MESVPNNNNENLRANLLSPSSQDPGLISRQQQNLIAMQTNLANEGGRNLYDSVDYIKACVAFFALKVIASVSVFIWAKSRCNKNLDTFLILMIVHDSFYTVRLILKLIVLLTSPHVENNSEGDSEAPMNRDPIQLLREFRVYEMKLKGLKVFSVIIYIFYCLTFLYGHYEFFQEDSDCKDIAPILNTISFIYLCLGYISVVIPIVFKSIVGLCSGISNCFSFFSRMNQARINNSVLKKMCVTYCEKRILEDPECAICIQDYKEGEKVAQLKCSEKHHFHYKCIKKWLKVNSFCPICRKKVDDKKDQTNTSRSS